MSSRKISRLKEAANNRQLSNVLTQFEQTKIQEFKEAFNMIDTNHDGVIEKEELRSMLHSLGENFKDFFKAVKIGHFDNFPGQNPKEKELDQMLKDAPSESVNFVMFLTMFGTRMQGTDPEEVIKNAFVCLDDDISGQIDMDFLREALTSMGNKFTDDEVYIFWNF